MNEKLEQALKTAARGFADRRICHFDVRVESVEDGRAKLIGSVLDESNRDAVRRTFAQKLPGLKLDDSAVRVLRTDAPPILRTVATSLTDLRREPSWLAERMTQVLNGQRLEILIEQERWCFVRQPSDGYLGWVYKSYLTDVPPVNATHLITGEIPVFTEAVDRESKAPRVLTRLFGGTSVHVMETRPHWALVRPLGAGMLPEGWVHTFSLREVAGMPLPMTKARKLMIHDASLFGTPYLWGGCSELGIDCSGLCQLVHRLSGYEIPRDADMQFAAGRVVEGSPFEPGDLLFFGGESTASDKRKVTHVGIATGDGWRMIHASRAHNGVYEDDVQEINHLRESYAGARSFLNRRDQGEPQINADERG